MSVEHLVLALAAEDTKFTRPFLTRSSVSFNKLRAAVEDIRGKKKVTSKNPELVRSAEILPRARFFRMTTRSVPSDFLGNPGYLFVRALNVST